MYIVNNQCEVIIIKCLKNMGVCRLCGKYRQLTFEHVPPKSAFNSTAVKVIPFEEGSKTITGENGRLPWDVEGLKFKITQKGNGDYYLCKKCNNDTGSWYMTEYVNFVKILHSMIQQENIVSGNYYSFTLKDIRPLCVFKAIMVMFCDINFNCFGDDTLRQFLLNKESKDIDLNKYSLYMNLTTSKMRRNQGCCVLKLSDIEEPIALSEISNYPISFTLYIDKPKEFNPVGLNLNHFANYNYTTKVNVDFYNIPCVDFNSFLPGDFRTKEEIQNARNNK